MNAKRRDRLRRVLKKTQASAMLVTNIVNVRYLTGFTGSSAYLLITPDQEVLLSDSRYQTQLQEECPDLEVEIRTASSTMLDSVTRVTRSMKVDSLAIEAQHLSKATYEILADKLGSVALVDTSGMVEGLRAIKDKSEIDAIRKSIQVNERAFEVITAQLTTSQTEREVAHNLEHQMRAFGASGCAFAPIVGVGPRAALPHGVPGTTAIGDGPILLIDWGANVDGYLSDLTRVIITGKVTARFEKIYQTVLQAQLAAIAAIRPGATLAEVDQAARDVIQEAGFGRYFGHGTGHSFGLEIHEQPFLSPIHDGTLKPGMVLTVEPGIYLPGFAGVRIEDDVLVTRDGNEVLSHLPKEFEQCQRHLGG